MNGTFDNCNGCGKEVKNPRYSDVGCVCSDKCRRSVKIPRLFSRSGLDDPKLKKMSLESFKFNEKELELRIRNFLDKPNSIGWLFIGKSGRGKTHLAVAIANKILEKYLLITLFISTTELLSSLYERFGVNAGVESLMSKYKDVDVLILDDLGSEKPTEYAVQQIYLLLDHRLRKEKLTIITSNYGLPKMAENISVRIASRLLEMCRVVKLGGGDYRTKIQKDIS